MTEWMQEFGFEQLRLQRQLIEAAVGTNEATTRLRAIDTMLYDVLGWDKLNVEVEHYVRTEGYADYAMNDSGIINLIIEAKRSEETFVLPYRKYPDTPIGFALLAKQSSAAEAALRQALGYAAQIGSRYIAITNGHQWLLTLTFVPNQKVTERSVFVFESIEAIEKKFDIFWQCFSPAGVLSNKAANLLIESRKAPAPTKLHRRIHGYPIPAERNSIADDVSTVLGAVWDEVSLDESSAEFLKECYVEPDSRFTSMSQAIELLEKRLSTDERIRVRATAPSEIPDLIQRYSPEKPVVILGKIGNGKSTFLNYLREIKAKDVLSKYIQIQINFLDRPDDPKEVGNYVYKQIELQLQENHGITITDQPFTHAALHADLAKFNRSDEGNAFPKDSPEHKREELAFIKAIKADPHTFLGKCLYHIRAGRAYSIAIFFDNLDRRQPEIQEEAYLKASAIARDCTFRGNAICHAAKLSNLVAVARISSSVTPGRRVARISSPSISRRHARCLSA